MFKISFIDGLYFVFKGDDKVSIGFKDEKMGVDFNKDFHAQSISPELGALAKLVGYRKPANASGSTGRYFFTYLKKFKKD